MIEEKQSTESKSLVDEVIRRGASEATDLMLRQRWEREAGYPGWERRIERLHQAIVCEIASTTALALIMGAK